MAKRSEPPTGLPATLTKQQGLAALSAMKMRGEQMLERLPVSEADADTWADSAIDYIKKTFGSRSNHVTTFIGPIEIEMQGFGMDDGPDKVFRQRRRAETLKNRIAVLGSLMSQLETDMALETPPTPARSAVTIWPLLHPKVQTSAKARFEAGHYADAVEAALKDLNSTVKELVKKKTGQELDGAVLMNKAFSPNAPVIVLDDLSTESGRNIQQGYMQVFAGSMIGVRNPKAHGNITISPERAIHFMFLASLLFAKLDERP